MNDLSKDYQEYCKKFKAVWGYLQKCSKDINTITNEICEHRLYFNDKEKWLDLFKNTGIVFVSSDSCDYSKLKSKEFDDLALFSKEGNFLLNERYIIPVRDMLGNIIALIGWYPDSKKYITTPSKFFVRDCLFFGLEQIKDTGIGKDYFLVEGIFDCLCLRALGFNAIAQMGVASSRVKKILYGLFGRLIAIPDNDKTGRGVLQNDKWSLPRNGSYFRWVGSLDVFDESEKIHIKDIDKLCSLYEDDDLKRLLSSLFKDGSRIIKVEL